MKLYIYSIELNQKLKKISEKVQNNYGRITGVNVQEKMESPYKNIENPRLEDVYSCNMLLRSLVDLPFGAIREMLCWKLLIIVYDYCN